MPKPSIVVGTMAVLAIASLCEAQVTLLSETGEVVRDWSPVRDLLVAEQAVDVGGRKVWHVHTMRPDGSGREVRTGRGAGAPPVTCHHGFAHFHPSGRYLLMSVEADENRQRPCGNPNSVPGIAAFANLWVLDLESGAWTNLTNYSGWRQATIYGALSPYFSADGNQVVWSKLARPSLGQPDKFFGEWELHVARFDFQGTPRLENDRVLLSGQMYEAHGFSPDDRSILFASDLGLQFSGGLDLFEYDLDTGATRNLTNSPTSYDEHARYSPDGAWIIWGSGDGVQGVGREATFWSEVNLMRRDGTERRRMTGSHTEGVAEYCGGCGSWPTTWSPDGRQALFAQQMFPVGRQPDRMWRLDLVLVPINPLTGVAQPPAPRR